jgi:phosphoribosylformimino-5-aminoimidazole carboxamide ribotide isomerase
MVKRFGDKIIVSVDARDGWVATTGWTELSHIRATDLIDGMASLGVKGIIYTDITRDGTLTEPNYAATGALVRPGGPAILASGGITHTDHLQRLAVLGIAGAIVGRALYTEHITLPAALEALQRRDTA